MEILKKFKSRKLWVAVIGVLMGVAMIFGVDPNVAETVSGAVVAVVSVWSLYVCVKASSLNCPCETEEKPSRQIMVTARYLAAFFTITKL